MLAPTDRRLLLDVLAPPEGYSLDQALGTTYTLDLLALLRVPLAATALPWSGSSGGPVDNPFALLTALRRNAARVSLFCNAGMTKVPARHVPLLAFLEDAVHPVTPPRSGGVFHPKLWLLRFSPEDAEEPIQYRLVVLSRNLTFDRSWDIALTVDGEVIERKRAFPGNRPLSDFIAALPQMARAAGHDLPPAASHRAELLSDEVLRVEWWLPDGFDDMAFHAIGHDGRASWPVADLHRLLVVAPFVHVPALARLRDETRSEMQLIGRFDELIRLDRQELAETAQHVDVFDDPGALLDVEDDAAPEEAQDGAVELSGLHAKVYVGERLRRAVVYVGSANATSGAFERNVEFLVELEGSRSQHGIDAVRQSLQDAGLLTPFKPGEPVEENEALATLERTLERAAHALAAGGLRASAEAAGDARWRLSLHRERDVNLDGLRLEARPLSDQTLRRVDLEATPCVTFPPTGLSSITPFFALRISGRAGDVERHLDVTARLRLDGAPDGRTEAVTSELLSDRERLLRFILLLLADDAGADRALEELAGLLTESEAGGTRSGNTAVLGLPLLEPLLRALHRSPERIDEIDRLLRDIRTAGGSTTDLVPAELEQLWTTLNAAKEQVG